MIQLNFTYNTEGFERSEGGFTGPCLASGATVCAYADLGVDSGFYASPGLGGAPLPNWSLLGGANQQVPMNSAWALFLMMVLILVVGLLNHKKHQESD